MGSNCSGANLAGRATSGEQVSDQEAHFGGFMTTGWRVFHHSAADVESCGPRGSRDRDVFWFYVRRLGGSTSEAWDRLRQFFRESPPLPRPPPDTVLPRRGRLLNAKPSGAVMSPPGRGRW